MSGEGNGSFAGDYGRVEVMRFHCGSEVRSFVALREHAPIAMYVELRVACPPKTAPITNFATLPCQRACCVIAGLLENGGLASRINVGQMRGDARASKELSAAREKMYRLIQDVTPMTGRFRVSG
jgi:hypothetical protein